MNGIDGLVTTWRPQGRHVVLSGRSAGAPEYCVEREQLLPLRLKEAWGFFSTPMNLARITPPDMRFEILSTEIDRPIFTGMRIEYNVRPLLGIKVRWLTEIRDVEPQRRFTDVQLNGPFAKWEHEHRFVGTPHGVLVQDRVVYRLPFGILGRLAHSAFVARRVGSIFDHREAVLRTIFATG